MNLVLFDIDGTLLRSEGAGRAAMVETMERLYGRPDAFEGVSFSGAVDPGLVAAALARVGVPATPRQLGRVRTTYLRALRRRMELARGAGRLTICRGAEAAVAELGARWPIGLMTGNWRRGALIKLSIVNLWAPFARGVGATGDDAADRDLLLPFAWRRAVRRGFTPSRVMVIGDTPSDVRAGQMGALALRAHGVEVQTVAVQTGFSTPEALAASGPTLQISDLHEGLGQVIGLLER